MLANPAESPKINWSQYKAAISVPGMVDNFQKQYEALKIPFPPDTFTSQIDAQWSQIQKEIEVFVKQSNANIEKYVCIFILNCMISSNCNKVNTQNTTCIDCRHISFMNNIIVSQLV